MATVHTKNSPTLQPPVHIALSPAQKPETSPAATQVPCVRDHYLQSASHLNPDGSLKIQDPKTLVLTPKLSVSTTHDQKKMEGFWGETRALEGFNWSWNLQKLFVPFLKYCSRVKGNAVVTQGGFHTIGTSFWKDYLTKLGVQNPDEEMWSFSTEASGLYEIYIRVPKDPLLGISAWVSIFLYFIAVQQFSERNSFFVEMMGELRLLIHSEPVVVDIKYAERLKNLREVSESLKKRYLKSSDTLELPLDTNSRLRIRFMHTDTELPNYPYRCDQLYLNLWTDDEIVNSTPQCPVGTPLQALSDQLLHRYELLFPKVQSSFSWRQLWARITTQGPALISESLVQELRNQPVSTPGSEEALKLLPTSLEAQLVFCWNVSLHSSPLWLSISQEKSLSPFGQLLNRYQSHFKEFSYLLAWMGGLQMLLSPTTDSPRCRITHQGDKPYLDISWKSPQRLHLLCEYDLKLAISQLREWLKRDPAKCLQAFFEALPLLISDITKSKLPSPENLVEFIAVCEEVYASLIKDPAHASSAIKLLEILKALKQKPVEISNLEPVLTHLPSLTSHARLQEATASLTNLCEGSPWRQLSEALQRRLNGDEQRMAEEILSICLEEFLLSGEKSLVSSAVSQIKSLQPATASTLLIQIAPRLTADVIPQILGRVCELTSTNSKLDSQEKMKLLQAYDRPANCMAVVSILTAVQRLASDAHDQASSSNLGQEEKQKQLQAHDQPIHNAALASILAAAQKLASHARDLQSPTQASYDSLVDTITPPEKKTEQFKKEWEEAQAYAKTSEMQPKVLFERLRSIQQKVLLDAQWKDDEQFVDLLLLCLKQIKPPQGDKVFHPWAQKCLEFWMAREKNAQDLITRSAELREAGYYDHLSSTFLFTLLRYLLASAADSQVRKEIAEVKKHLKIEKTQREEYRDLLMSLFQYTPPAQLIDDLRSNLALFAEDETYVRAVQAQLDRVAAYLREHTSENSVWHRFRALLDELRSDAFWTEAVLTTSETLAADDTLKKLNFGHPLFVLFLRSWSKFEKKCSDPQKIRLGQVLVRVCCRALEEKNEDARPADPAAQSLAQMRESVLSSVRHSSSLSSYASLVFVYATKRKTHLLEPLRWIGTQLRTVEVSPHHAEYAQVVAAVPLKELKPDAKEWKPLLARLCTKCPSLIKRLIDLAVGNEIGFFQECQTLLTSNPAEAGRRLTSYADTETIPAKTLPVSDSTIDSLLKQRPFTKDTLNKILDHPKAGSLTKDQWGRLIDRLSSEWEDVFDRLWQLWLTTHPGTETTKEDQDLLRKWITVILKGEPTEKTVSTILMIAEKASLTRDHWCTLISKLSTSSTTSLDRAWKHWLKLHPSDQAKEEDSDLWKQWVEKLTLTSHEQPFVDDLALNHVLHLVKRLRPEEARRICKVCLNLLLDVCVLNLQYNATFFQVLEQLLNNPEIEAKVGRVADLLEPKEKALFVDMIMANHPDPQVQQKGRTQFFQKLNAKQFPPAVMFEYFCFKPFPANTEEQATLWELAEQVLSKISTSEEVLQPGRWFTIVSRFSFPFTVRGREIHLQTHLLPQFQRLLQGMGHYLSRSSAVPQLPSISLALMQQVQNAFRGKENPLTQGITTFIDGSLAVLNKILQQGTSRDKLKVLNLLHPLLEQLEKERAPAPRPAMQPSARRNKKDKAAVVKQFDRLGGKKLDVFQQAILTGIQMAAGEFGDQTPAETILNECDDTRAQVARLRFRWIYWGLQVWRDLNNPSTEESVIAEYVQLVLTMLPPTVLCFEELSKTWNTEYGPGMESLIGAIPFFIALAQKEPKLREPLLRVIASSFSVLNPLMVEQLDDAEKIELLRKYSQNLQTFEEVCLSKDSAPVKNVRRDLAQLWLVLVQNGMLALRLRQFSSVRNVQPVVNVSLIKSIIPRIKGWMRESEQNTDALAENLLEEMPFLLNLTEGDPELFDHLLGLLHFLGGCDPLPNNLGQALAQFERIFQLIGRISKMESFPKKNCLIRALVGFLPAFTNPQPSTTREEPEAAQLAGDRVQLLARLLSSPDMEMLTCDDWRSFLPALAPPVVHQLLDLFLKGGQLRDVLGVCYIMNSAGFKDPSLFERLCQIVDKQTLPKLFDNPKEPMLSLLCRSRYTKGIFEMYSHSTSPLHPSGSPWESKRALLKKQLVANLTGLLIKVMTSAEHLYLLADRKKFNFEQANGKICFRDVALEAVVLSCCAGSEPMVVKQCVKLALKHMVDPSAFNFYMDPLKQLVNIASLESLKAMRDEITPALNNPIYGSAQPVAAPAPRLANRPASDDLFGAIFAAQIAELQSTNPVVPKYKLVDLYLEISKKIAEKEEKK